MILGKKRGPGEGKRERVQEKERKKQRRSNSQLPKREKVTDAAVAR